MCTCDKVLVIRPNIKRIFMKFTPDEDWIYHIILTYRDGTSTMIGKYEHSEARGRCESIELAEGE